MATDTQTDFSVEVGDAIRVCDELGRVHHGLVTIVHGYRNRDEYVAAVLKNQPNVDPDTIMLSPPPINAVYVTDDDTKRDPYGHQLERLSSLSHRSTTSAPGRWWDFL